VCKQETTQPGSGQGGSQAGEQDSGYCYGNKGCEYVPSIQQVKAKHPSVCCGADLGVCQNTCVKQNTPPQTEQGDRKQGSVSVDIALEEKIECTNGILSVLAHVKNTGTEILSNVRLVVYGEDPMTRVISEHLNLKAGAVKDVNVKIKCTNPLKAFI